MSHIAAMENHAFSSLAEWRGEQEGRRHVGSVNIERGKTLGHISLLALSCVGVANELSVLQDVGVRVCEGF